MTILYHDQLFFCDACQQEKAQIERYYANRSRFIVCKTCASQGKHCSRCMIYKLFSEFIQSQGNRKRGNVTAYCKKCTQAYVHDTYNPMKRRAERLKTRFNLMPEEYDAMLAQQGGVCAICKQPETGMDNTGKKVRALAVDHDHETGAIRQLLCGSCNYLLGYVKDNAERLQAASEYLKKHQRH
jgi:Recombination endonuclease VII